MTDKGFNLFDECAARCVHLFPQEEECTSSSWGDSKMYTSRSIAIYKLLWVELITNGGVIFIAILLHFHYFISLETANT